MSQKINLVRNMVAAMKHSKGFDRIYQLEVLSASEGKCALSWKIDKNLLNMQGTMHGGLMASIIDTATTVALGTTGRGLRGVSLELSVSFIGAARVGDTLKIEALCKKVGSRIAFTEASVTNQEGKLLATGKHTKFLSPQEETIK